VVEIVLPGWTLHGIPHAVFGSNPAKNLKLAWRHRSELHSPLCTQASMVRTSKSPGLKWRSRHWRSEERSVPSLLD